MTAYETYYTPRRRSRRGGNSLKRRLGIAFRLGLVLLPIVLIVIGAGVWIVNGIDALRSQDETMIPIERPRHAVWDPAKLLEGKERRRIERLVNVFNESLQADCEIVVLRKWDPREIQALAEKTYRQWHVGNRSFGERGALLVVAVEQKKAALVLGNGLENSLKSTTMTGYTDVSDLLEDQHLRNALERERLAEGLESSLNLLQNQFQAPIADPLAQEDIPKEIGSIQ